MPESKKTKKLHQQQYNSHLASTNRLLFSSYVPFIYVRSFAQWGSL